jgi:hypothetical protein
MAREEKQRREESLRRADCGAVSLLGHVPDV